MTDDNRGLVAALDRAIRQVERAIASGMRTRAGDPATPQLERLGAELAAHRASAAAHGAVDRAWVGQAVRSVAEWAPEDEVALLAALGAIARAG